VQDLTAAKLKSFTVISIKDYQQSVNSNLIKYGNTRHTVATVQLPYENHGAHSE